MADIWFSDQEDSQDPSCDGGAAIPPSNWSTDPTTFSDYGQLPQPGDTATFGYAYSPDNLNNNANAWCAGVHLIFSSLYVLGGISGTTFLPAPLTIPNAASISSDSTITWSGATVTGAFPTISAVGSTFTADPGTAISGTSGAQYNADIASDITDEGTGIFNAANTFSGTVVISGAVIGGTTGGTFTGAVTAASITGGTFTGAVTAASISGGTFTGAMITCSNITGGTFTDCMIHQSGAIVFNPASDSGNDFIWTSVTSVTASSSEILGTFSTAPADDILTTAGGNYVPTPADKVEDKFPFGPNSSLLGTLPTGGSTSLTDGEFVTTPQSVSLTNGVYA